MTSRSAIRNAKRIASQWFRSRGWNAFAFQKKAWDAYLGGQSGLIHATTGTGKTLAIWMAPVIEWLSENPACRHRKPDGLQVLWITPLRALATDTLHSLKQPIDELQLNWTVETRTSDTAGSVRRRQRQRLPNALITTPESLSLLLTRSDAQEKLGSLRLVVCDEWHELLSTKRGVQVELALARLRRWKPDLRVWGLSATLGNLNQAIEVLVGSEHVVVDGVQRSLAEDSERPNSGNASLIQGHHSKKIVIDSLIPRKIDRFPWAGHLGLRLLPDVVKGVEAAGSSLLFTNTRSQTEIWYQAMLQARPDWAGQIALHHGSMDSESRSWVEDKLRSGALRCVVCTSSLDLGVDFSQVDRVFQVGSPKGIARLLQRAGRSGHSPGASSRVTCVPAHALELIEVAAARDAVRSGFIESRHPPVMPLDVLCQHAVTIAAGTGFRAEELLNEVRQTFSFRDLSSGDWQWILEFVSHGGQSLRSYPDYHKLKCRNDVYVVGSEKIARQHRMSIGTIMGDASLNVQYMSGGRLGTIEESFASKLKPGDFFTFAGRTLELVSVREMVVWVRRATRSTGMKVPRWMGGRMPLSTELASAVRLKLKEAGEGVFEAREMQAVRPILELQARWSLIPAPGTLLIESVRSREGHHLFFYPFAGRLVHEGLSALFAWRIAQCCPITFSMSVNDYGFELLSAQEAPLAESLNRGLISTENLLSDIEACCNASEMGKRQFREIARVSGLVFQGYPGSPKSSRQLQASSGLLYDVFAEYESDNLLLKQSRSEVLERQLEHSRLVSTLNELSSGEIMIQQPLRFTPLAFPLLVERLREKLSSEKLADRISRMQLTLERAAS